jgi:hypothetical protein
MKARMSNPMNQTPSTAAPIMDKAATLAGWAGSTPMRIITPKIAKTKFQQMTHHTFTGAGTTVRSSHRSFFDDGVCVSRESSSGRKRTATFSGTLDGSAFRPVEAWLRDGMYSISSTCAVPIG